MQKIVKARFLCMERKFKTMSQHLLDIENLTVAVEDKEILHGVNLQVNEGETHVLMGPNGAGKSTLGYALMGNPQYKVTGGSILFHGKEQQGLSADQRAKAGMFLSFQNPLEVPGLSLKSFVRSTLAQRTGKRVKLFAFEKQFNEAAKLLQMDPAYGDRDLNVGFSGGEKKKAEILQMLLLRPSLAILDETDSGLDVDAVRTVSWRGGLSKRAKRRPADHYPLHPYFGEPACGLHPYFSQRTDRKDRRRLPGGRDQRPWV